MRRFRILWLIICVMVLVSGISLMFWYHCHHPYQVSDLINIGLGVTAIFASFVAILLGDQKAPQVKAKLGVWSPKNEHVGRNQDKDLVVFRIANRSAQVIEDIVVLISFPVELAVHCNGGYHTTIGDCRQQAKTSFVTYRDFKYLDTAGEHSNLEIRIGLQLDSWPEQRVLYLTILGNNMISQRYRINNNDIPKIRAANSAVPYFIQSL